MGPVTVAVSMKTRDLLWRRCGGYCEVGGEPLPTDGFWSVHHRRLRKHGGTNDPWNLMAVCHEHHNLATRSIHLRPAEAYSRGWLVSQAHDPRETLVRIFGAHWVMLGETDQYEHASGALLETLTKMKETK